MVASTQRSNTVTKKRTTGPPMLPPIDPNEGGGGGGGGGWGKIARNVLLNAALLGAFFAFEMTSHGDGGGFFGGGKGASGWLWGGAVLDY